MSFDWRWDWRPWPSSSSAWNHKPMPVVIAAAVPAAASLRAVSRSLAVVSRSHAVAKKRRTATATTAVTTVAVAVVIIATAAVAAVTTAATAVATVAKLLHRLRLRKRLRKRSNVWRQAHRSLGPSGWCSPLTTCTANWASGPRTPTSCNWPSLSRRGPASFLRGAKNAVVLAVEV